MITTTYFPDDDDWHSRWFRSQEKPLNRPQVRALTRALASKKCKPHIMGALIAAILVGNHDLDFPRLPVGRPRPFRGSINPFGVPPRPWDDFNGLVPRRGDWPFAGSARPSGDNRRWLDARSLWLEIRRVAALLEELDAESGDSSSPEAIAAAIEKEYDFAVDEEDLYVPLVALAFASLRWEEEIVFKIFNNLLSEFESIANNPLTPQMMRLMFMTIRGAILGNDPRQELLRHIALLPSESRELAQAVMNGEETPRGVEYSSYSTLRDLREVLELLASKSTFKEVYAALSDHNGDAKQWQTAKKVLLAVMAGGVFGIHRIPSELATYVQVFEDTQNGLEVYTLPDLQDLALTLAGFSPIKDTPPEAPLGPKKVDQNVYAGNLDGVANAMRQLGFPDDWAVLSLCRPQGRFDGLRFRRLFYLIDKKGSINPDLAAIVQDAVDEIDQHLAEGRKVVVHCHGGRSRTALILKAWKMRRDGLDEAAAHDWLTSSWTHANRQNSSFVDFLTNEWPKIIESHPRG